MTQVARQDVMEGFDTLHQVAHDPLGVALDFVTGYDDYKKVVKDFDWTNVDHTAVTNLAIEASKQMSRKAFETAASVLDKGIDVFAGVSGATGQWYAVAGSLLGEKMLNWAESAFEDYMGGEKEPDLKKGDWVVIDLGQRRRLPDQSLAFMEEVLEEEQLRHDDASPQLASKEPLEKAQHIALYQGEESDGNRLVVDVQDNMEKWVRKAATRRYPHQEELWADDNFVRLANAVRKEERHRGSSLNVGVNTRVGDTVIFKGESWMLASAGNRHKARIVSDGMEKSVPWHELTAAYNDTTHTPVPGNAVESGFVQMGDGPNTGDYVWLRGEEKSTLGCVESCLGPDKVWAVSAVTGSGGTWAVKDVAPVTNGYAQGEMFATWRAAVVHKEGSEVMRLLPSRWKPQYCVSFTGEHFGNPFSHRDPVEPHRGGGLPDAVQDTNRWAVEDDQARVNYQSKHEQGGFAQGQHMDYQAQEFRAAGRGGADKGTDNSLFVMLGIAAVAAFVLTQ